MDKRMATSAPKLASTRATAQRKRFRLRPAGTPRGAGEGRSASVTAPCKGAGGAAVPGKLFVVDSPGFTIADYLETGSTMACSS